MATETDFALRPSAAARWVACGASVPLEAEAPLPEDAETAKARTEGDAAHWAGANELKGAWASTPVGAVAPNGVVFDEEMREAVDLYVAEVNSHRIAGAELHVEESVACPTIHPDNGGTPDCWSFVPRGNGGLLQIWDFKYGHRYVDAFVNWQLVDYAAGILARLEFRNVDHREVKVVMTVVQPRNYHPAGPVRSWTTEAVKLAGYWQDLRDAASEAMSDTPKARVNPECRDCKGRHRCAALHLAAETAMDVALSAVPLDLSASALGVELRFLRRNRVLLDARISGLETVAESKLRAGEGVPFFGLVPGQSKEIWTEDAATVIAMGEALGVSLAKMAAPITPNQARGALKKAGLDETLLTGFSDRPPGAMKLSEVDETKAAKVFGA